MAVIKLEFLGKDSVPFSREIEVSDEVYSLLQKMKEGKNANDEIFDKAGAGDVSLFLKEIDKSLSPKVLRTAKCNTVLIENLKKQKVTKDSSMTEKLAAIYNSNLAIAKELNHQKNVGKNQKAQEEKSNDKLSVAEKKLKELKKQLKEADEKRAAKLKNQISTQKERVEAAKLQAKKKSETADIALGTSLGNYADPRIVYSYCKYIDLPIDKVYNKSLQEKFSWAESVDENYWKTI